MPLVTGTNLGKSSLTINTGSITVAPLIYLGTTTNFVVTTTSTTVLAQNAVATFTIEPATALPASLPLAGLTTTLTISIPGLDAITKTIPLEKDYCSSGEKIAP